MNTNQQRAWVRLPSGRRIDLINPDPNSWTNHDLAASLARVARWGGHSVWPRPYSTAQHSMLVLELLRMQSPEPLDPITELRELLHDTDEAWTGFDPISPLKQKFNPEFLAMLDNLTKVTFQRYGVPWWTPEEKIAHKRADVLAAASEALHVAGWSRQEIREDLQIVLEPMDFDPLAALYDETPWKPWSTRVATKRYLAKLESLLGQIYAQAA